MSLQFNSQNTWYLSTRNHISSQALPHKYVNTTNDQKLGAGRPANEANGTQTVSLSHMVCAQCCFTLYAICCSFESEMWPCVHVYGA